MAARARLDAVQCTVMMAGWVVAAADGSPAGGVAQHGRGFHHHHCIAAVGLVVCELPASASLHASWTLMAAAALEF